ncbi:MAG TPA: hypothetical protein ENK52_05385, partial [Saprospiraceae bacterium]|nr:hypothetical protein [Saprospiraceae bacterium]
HTVTWSYPTDLEYGQCWWPTVSVTFSSADYAVGDSVLNTGHLSYTPIGESPTTISTSVMLYFEAAKTEGSLSKTPYSSTRIQGEWGRYKIKFKNTSNIPIDNFYIEDIIPAGITITHFNTGGFYGLGGLQFSIKYTTNLNPVWTTSPGSPYNQNSNATENVSTYGLASNEYITGLRWDFSPGQFAIGSGLKSSQAIYINYNVNKDAPLGDITNCVTAGGDAITYSLTNANSCATFEVLPGINGFVSAPRKDFKERTCNCWTYFSSDYYNVGDTLSFRLQMENHITSSTNIPNPSLADLLPNGLTYIDGSWAFENSGYVVPAPTFTKTVNHNGTGRTLLKWDWTGYSLGPDTTFFVTFDAVIGIASPSGAGGLVNEYAILQYDNNGCTSGNIQKADTFDLDGDGNTTEEFCFAKTEININEFFSLESEKLVKGQLDSTYTKYPQTGSSVPGGISDYKLTVKNTGNIPVDSIIIVDILPFVNDTGVVDLTARLSRWSPNLVSTVQAPAGVTVYYSTEKNPCRAAEGLVPSGPPSCSPPNWNTSPPADLTMVQSLKFEFGQNTLYPNDSVQLNWAMRVPVNALATIGAAPDSIAWNSFGFIGKRTDNGLKTLPSEPLKVGINLTDIVPNVYGDKVWNDTNQNGIQDLGESGINGIRVELYKDNNNGIIEPNLDTFINFTLTGNGGYYLFPNLDDGNYYAVFYQPNAYSISPNDMGGNDGIDSDGSPLTVNGFPATITPITNLSGLEYDLTWDQGFYPSPNGAIGNYVWNDDNGDGIQNEAAALGVNGIWIYLYDNATPSVILDSTITQNDVNGNPGHYYFDNIPAGNYFLEMKLPTDVSITSLGTTGSSDPLDSDFDVATHRTEVFVVTSGTYDENWDLGLILSGIENCSNGIDDDLDGLTDCQDIDDCTPIANPATLNTCDNSNGAGSGSFILHDANPTVSVESGVIISYHPTLVDANNNANILISPYPSSSGILYARVERISSGCF